MRKVEQIPDGDADLALQARMLEGVSRTFALTIPQLPPALFRAVANAYLLCRIADTIEDDPGLDAEAKRLYSEGFIRVLDDVDGCSDLAGDLLHALSPGTPTSERELIENIPCVVRITRRLDERQQVAMRRCVRIMSRGMAGFQRSASRSGLADVAELDRYCYVVAGVVGEMLTELFCVHSPAIAARRDPMLRLAVGFGQGLQMTNILKDVWEDLRRGVCWLPRDVFARCGFDLADLTPGCSEAGFLRGYRELVTVASGHLGQALEYTLQVPSGETGIRRFCLWALGMAVLTLRRIHSRPGFASGAEVKISRRQVRAVIALSNLSLGSDWLLRSLFALGTRSLSQCDGHRHAIST